LLARTGFCDITPRGRPVRLAGYASRQASATAILDPIEISAVLLEADGRRCLIVSFDLMIVGSELQAMIQARLARHGFRPSEIILLASHTHFAPATDRACAALGEPDAQFTGDAAAATETLLLRLLNDEPFAIRLDISRGRLDHSINRRRFWPLPTLSRTYGFRASCVAMAPNPNGATNELATIILLRRADNDATIGAIWHYTCHPTAVVPSDVISADFPGTVRRGLRKHFGDMPVVFAQGFCGDVSPNRARAKSTFGFRDRLRRLARIPIAGPTFPPATQDDWRQWSESLAAAVVRIALGAPRTSCSPTTLATGSAAVPLGVFFTGAAPDKPLVAQVLTLGGDIELLTLSAEVTVEWEAILDREAPVRDGALRLYAGYLGALYGYLPTPDQIREGGYEVTGFQSLFGLSGHFDAKKIVPTVADCVKRAFDELTSAT
jgi:hypothetical protein